jgi:prepilin-type N-terminal cleavage/methylation domain-containing protein
MANFAICFKTINPMQLQLNGFGAPQTDVTKKDFNKNNNLFYMKQNKIKKHSLKSGFTLIEILFVIIIIGILAAVILVSLSSAKESANDKSTLMALRSITSSAYACLTSEDTKLSYMTTTRNICTTKANVNVAGYEKWPDLSKYGWDNKTAGSFTTSGLTWRKGSNFVGWSWCPIGWSSNSYPNIIGNFGFSCGGSQMCGGEDINGTNLSGRFCYALKKGANKYIWCTEEGCKKEGF